MKDEKSRKLIVALDLSPPGRARQLGESLAPLGVSLKIGLELFMAGGPELVRDMASRYPVFLDLKFHDIPNTVARAVTAAAELGVWMLNIHAPGGAAMIQAAREALEAFPRPPLLVAVTVLTSLDEQSLAETGSFGGVAERVKTLTNLALRSGADGVVCSPLEIRAVKEAASSSFLTVTPGVRPAGTARDDQQRVATPGAVIQAGGDYLVVGRPITGAADPAASAAAILAEMGVSP